MLCSIALARHPLLRNAQLALNVAIEGRVRLLQLLLCCYATLIK